MLTRLSAMLPINTRGMWIGTFHGLCNRMLRAHYRDAGLPSTFQILDHADQLGGDQAAVEGASTSTTSATRRAICSMFINSAKEAGLRANATSRSTTSTTAASSSCTPPTTRSASAKAWSISPSCCCAATSCSMRNETLREHYQSRFRHILVDEFQDTNRLQYAWLKLLAGTEQRRFSRSATTTSASSPARK